MKQLLSLLVAAPLFGQAPLSLREAAQLALRENRSVVESEAAVNAATARISRARSGALPKIDYSESFTRGNNPVFVFGSLLTQHQFGMENFNIGPLNRPAALNNFQSQLTVDQVLYDGGQTATGVKSARLGREMSVPAWFLFTAFVGVNLFQSAFTDWCPMMTFLRKLRTVRSAPRI